MGSLRSQAYLSRHVPISYRHVGTSFRSRFMGFLAGLCLSGASVMLALGLGELYMRIFLPQPIIPRYVEAGEFGIRKNIAHVRGRMIVPEYQHDFSTNAQGFRGTRDYALSKPDGVFRIIILGDSTVLGHGVGDDQTFSYLLEQELSKVRPVEVINMGVSGFGTAEELIQLQEVGFKYAPDLVVLGYFPNDPYNNAVSKLFALSDGKLIRAGNAFVPALYVRDRLYSIPGWSFLCQHSHLVNFVRNNLSAYFQKRLGAEEGLPSTTPERLTVEQKDMTVGLIRALASESARHDAKFILLNIPVVVDGRTIDNLPHELVAGSDSLVTIDVLREVYSGQSMASLYYEKDSHPTVLAHRLIAAHLAQVISRQMNEEHRVEQR